MTLGEAYRTILACMLVGWQVKLMGLYGPYRVSEGHSEVGGECHPTL